jgi:hypothetical protein
VYTNPRSRQRTASQCGFCTRLTIAPTSLFGFLSGATAAGAGMYYYVIDEYRVSNQLLTEDIYVCLRYGAGCGW